MGSSSSVVPPTPPTRMRCYYGDDGTPFCDTWWSIEPSRDEPGYIDLVFGTALLKPDYNHNNDGDNDNDNKDGKKQEVVVPSSSSSSSVQVMLFKWMITVLDPFHRLYSCLLLASARANMEMRTTMIQQQQQQQQ